MTDLIYWQNIHEICHTHTRQPDISSEAAPPPVSCNRKYARKISFQAAETDRGVTLKACSCGWQL